MHLRSPGRPRSPHTEQSVFTAALTLFEERGYGGTTVEAIARAAGVGKQTIYRRWPGKAHLAADLYESIVPREEIVSDTGSLHGDIRAMIGALFDTYDRGPAAPLLAGLIAESQGDATASTIFRTAFFDNRSRTTRDLFQRAVSRGDLPRETDIGFLSDLLIGAIWMRLLVRHAPLDEEFAHRLADHFANLDTAPGAVR